MWHAWDRKRDKFKDLGVNRKMILKYTLNKQDGRT
jgi:hypothetical protein